MRRKLSVCRAHCHSTCNTLNALTFLREIDAVHVCLYQCLGLTNCVEGSSRLMDSHRRREAVVGVGV